MSDEREQSEHWNQDESDVILLEQLATIRRLTKRLAAAEAERDVLLACRHGDQRCFECPDTKCCDNLNEAAKGATP